MEEGRREGGGKEGRVSLRLEGDTNVIMTLRETIKDKEKRRKERKTEWRGDTISIVRGGESDYREGGEGEREGDTLPLVEMSSVSDLPSISQSTKGMN